MTFGHHVYFGLNYITQLMFNVDAYKIKVFFFIINIMALNSLKVFNTIKIYTQYKTIVFIIGTVSNS